MATDFETPTVDSSTVVFVEGVSDQLAVETLAVRRGRNLAAEGISVLPMGGATNIGHYLDRFGPSGADLVIAGLYDEAEERFFQRALAKAGLGSELGRLELERLGFYLCSADLEDELIRALGVARIEEILEANGDLHSFRTFQQQPAQQGKSDEARLRRFMGTRGGRKIEYARLLVDALELDRVPRPLDLLLASV
jgi:hypothetical protein